MKLPGGCMACMLLGARSDEDVAPLAIASIVAGMAMRDQAGTMEIDSPEDFFCDEHAELFIDCLSLTLRGGP